MTPDAWWYYLATLLVFMAAPGPSHLLMLSTSLGNGMPRSLATAAGDLSANLLQMSLAGLGLAVVVTSSATVFLFVKLAGVAYLVWLGARQFVASFRNRSRQAIIVPASLWTLWMRGFVTSAANPKAVVFFAALFPQFIQPGSSPGLQIAILGATYLVVDGLFLAAYGFGATGIRKRLREDRLFWIDRLAGAGLIGVAIMLGLRGAVTRS